MKAPQLFGLALRVMGLIFLYDALSGFPGGFFKLIAHLTAFKVWSAIEIIAGTLWPLALALWFLRGAPWLMQLTYPSESRDSTPG
jgi:hypothetical protein